MTWLSFRCPGCNARKSVQPGSTYKICGRCAAVHCHREEDMCCIQGCTGRLHEAINLGGGGRFPEVQSPVHYDPK